jgi:hypothetical protein
LVPGFNCSLDLCGTGPFFGKSGGGWFVLHWSRRHTLSWNIELPTRGRRNSITGFSLRISEDTDWCLHYSLSHPNSSSVSHRSIAIDEREMV